MRLKSGFIYKIEGEEFFEPSVDIGVGIIPEVNGVWVNTQHTQYIEKKDILKHSPNIIDVIEVGDYVNGKRVEGIDDKEFYDHREIFFENECWYIKDYHIESIVTHQQFNSIKYEVI